jgi:acyl-CoA thioester hydrolase
VDAGQQPGVILARLEVDYRRQLYYRAGEVLPVRSRVLRLGTSSVTMAQELLQDGEVAIDLVAVCVMFDPATGRSRPLADGERAYWGSYLAA